MLISLLIGALIGWLAGRLMGSKGGLIRNILLGLAGSAVGNYIATSVGLGPTTSIGAILIGVGGACLLILVGRWLFGKK